MSEVMPPHYGEQLRRDVEVMAFSDVAADSAFMPSRLALQLTNVHFVGLTVQPGRWRRGGAARTNAATQRNPSASIDSSSSLMENGDGTKVAAHRAN